MSLEAMVIDLGKKTALISACGITININIKQQGQFFARKLFTSQENVISACSKAMIFLLKLPLSDNQYFLFYPTPQANLSLYYHIIDYKTSKILVRNTFDLPLCMSCWHKLGHFLDMPYKNYFLINTQAAYDAAFVLPFSHPFSNFGTEPTLPPTDALMETVLHNRIRMFGDSNTVKQIANLVAKYPSI